MGFEPTFPRTLQHNSRIFDMALLNILVYPDSRLRTVAKPVEAVDSNIVTLVDDMAQTMYAAPGIGLAATQVNIPKRVIVMDLSETRDKLMLSLIHISEPTRPY